MEEKPPVIPRPSVLLAEITAVVACPWPHVSDAIVGVTVDVKNHVWGAHATEFLATGTAVRRLTDEHRLPETSPKPTFTLGLDN